MIGLASSILNRGNDVFVFEARVIGLDFIERRAKGNEFENAETRIRCPRMQGRQPHLPSSIVIRARLSRLIADWWRRAKSKPGHAKTASLPAFRGATTKSQMRPDSCLFHYEDSPELTGLHTVLKQSLLCASISLPLCYRYRIRFER